MQMGMDLVKTAGEFVVNAAEAVATTALDYAALAVEALSCAAGECNLIFRITKGTIPFPPYPEMPKLCVVSNF
eukprot:tig00000767_g3961.t1